MSNRRILVLGGSGDIGSAICQEFENDSVISLGSRDVDLSNSDSVKEFISLNKPFDVIIHSAGFNVPGIFETSDIGEIEKGIRTNLTGFLPIIQNNIPYWRETGTGRLVIISSIYGFFSRAGRLPYAMSKHGLIGLVKTLAIELGPLGVMVNAVSPGYIDTKLTKKNNTQETIDRLVQGVPVGRMGTAKEVAGSVAFLASEKNTYINGHDLVIDGGYSIGGFQR